MLDRIRREYSQRFFVGASDQVLSSEATPRTQASVTGQVVAGSLIGALVGGALGFLAGGIAGAVIGSVLGLLGGAFVGGLTGSLRKGSE
jgi:uncharacterized membrane protein